MRPMSLSARRFVDTANRVPKLTREQEADLARRFHTGDESAGKALLSANARYAIGIAMEHARYEMPMEDILSEACVGMAIALRKFDPDRGLRFVTYAGWWARALIARLVAGAWSSAFNGGGERSRIFFRVMRLSRDCVTPEETREAITKLSKELRMKPATIEQHLNWFQARDRSLDAPVSPNADVTLLEVLPSDAPSPESVALDLVTNRRMTRRVRHALRVLDERERLIVHKRVMADEPLSLEALGQILGVTRERVRQIEQRAIRKLRGPLSKLNAERREAA